MSSSAFSRDGSTLGGPSANRKRQRFACVALSVFRRGRRRHGGASVAFEQGRIETKTNLCARIDANSYLFSAGHHVHVVHPPNPDRLAKVASFSSRPI
jgi:hypothetical protein